MKYKFIP